MEKTDCSENSQGITIEKLAQKVSDMRRAQRQYFKSKEFKYLDRSKELEKEVDAMTNQILNPQTSLF